MYEYSLDEVHFHVAILEAREMSMGVVLVSYSFTLHSYLPTRRLRSRSQTLLLILSNLSELINFYYPEIIRKPMSFFLMISGGIEVN